SCDTEVLVHLYEERGERMMDDLRGQYAFALYDRRRRTLLLARDRLGIVPLHWARRGDWFYFGSEIKAILASAAVAAEPDARGLDHIFTFFGMATRRTAFKGISAVHPASYLKIQFREDGEAVDPVEHRYWDLDFPDRGDEYTPASDAQAIAEFHEVFD